MEAAAKGAVSNKTVFIDPALLGINVAEMLKGLSGTPGIPGGGLVSTESSGSYPEIPNLGQYGNSNSNSNNHIEAAVAAAPPKSILKKRSAANSVIHSEQGLMDHVIPYVVEEFNKEIRSIYVSTLKSVIERLAP